MGPKKPRERRRKKEVVDAQQARDLLGLTPLQGVVRPPVVQPVVVASAPSGTAIAAAIKTKAPGFAIQVKYNGEWRPARGVLATLDHWENQSAKHKYAWVRIVKFP